MSGIYLHIPFCRRACHYCDFHFTTNLARKNDFPGALLKELALRADYLGGESVETIYFGGGTPSLLEPAAIATILTAIRSRLAVAPDAEVTLEANPDDIDRPRVAAWLDAGINRLSIGLQSFFEDDLRWMNRAHTAAQSLDAVAAARDGGIGNLSIDLIYGLPGAEVSRWAENLRRAGELDVPHLSCYALTVESRTALARRIARHQQADTDPEQQARDFFSLMDWAAGSGYEQYEISNFARPGFYSRHNRSYWQGKKYLGLGPSAHSFDGESRQWNVSGNTRWFDALDRGELLFEREVLGPRERLNELVMTSLRTREGLDLAAVAAAFGTAQAADLAARAAKYRKDGRIEPREDRLVLTREGKLFADGIAADLFEVES